VACTPAPPRLSPLFYAALELFAFGTGCVLLSTTAEAAGRDKSSVWQHFTADTTDPKKPWKCNYDGTLHAKDATVNTVYLAFRCKAFKEEHADEWVALVRSISEDTMKRQSAANQAIYEQVKTKAKGKGKAPASDADAAGGSAESGGAGAAAGGSGSVWLGGAAAALRNLPQNTLSGYVQRMSPEHAEAARQLLFKFQVAANLPLTVFDRHEWKDFLQVVSPAFATVTFNYDYIRCGCRDATGWRGSRSALRNNNYLNMFFTELHGEVERIKSAADAICTGCDGWTDSHHNTIINVIDVANGMPFWGYQVLCLGCVISCLTHAVCP
jgi:hypothetical protein